MPLHSILLAGKCISPMNQSRYDVSCIIKLHRMYCVLFLSISTQWHSISLLVHAMCMITCMTMYHLQPVFRCENVHVSNVFVLSIVADPFYQHTLVIYIAHNVSLGLVFRSSQLPG